MNTPLAHSPDLHPAHHPVHWPSEHSGPRLDRWAYARRSPFTRGVSTASLCVAFDDGLAHWTHNPAEQFQLLQRALQSSQQWRGLVAQAQQALCKPCIEPTVQGTCFAYLSWQNWPLNPLGQGFLLTQPWWQDACLGVRGVSLHHESVVHFTVRQMLDMVSPAKGTLDWPPMCPAPGACMLQK